MVAQCCADLGQQHGAVHSLHDVIARSVFEPAYLIAGGMASAGQDDNWPRGARGRSSELIQDLDGVHIGKLEIKDCQIGLKLLSESQPIRSAMGDLHVIAGPLQEARRQHRLLGVVLDHQNPLSDSAHQANLLHFKQF